MAQGSSKMETPELGVAAGKALPLVRGEQASLTEGKKGTPAFSVASKDFGTCQSLHAPSLGTWNLGS